MWVVVVGAPAWHIGRTAGAAGFTLAWLERRSLDDLTTLAGRLLAHAAQEVERPLRRTTCGKPNKNSPDRARYVATSASADQSRRGGNGCRKHR